MSRLGPAGALVSLGRRGLLRLQAAGSLLYRLPYTVLSVRSDLGGWVLDREAEDIRDVALHLGIRAFTNLGLADRARQCCHYTSQFVLAQPKQFLTRQRVSVDLLHGLPEVTPELAYLHEALKARHPALARLRVSHRLMETRALESGIDPEKVHRIPLGVRLERFPLVTPAERRESRAALELPLSAVVLGSFQKDGVGWKEGLEPKRVKGPDVLLEAVALLRRRVPELWVLLAGPARGFVKAGLDRAGVPWRSVSPMDHRQLARCFWALDAYLVVSRDEGGPKALLEAMASGVPLVTTRVGQAADLVRHNENGWVVESGDVDGLAHWAQHAVSTDTAAIVRKARATAERHSYQAQAPLWAAFFRGFVEGC